MSVKRNKDDGVILMRKAAKSSVWQYFGYRKRGEELADRERPTCILCKCDVMTKYEDIVCHLRQHLASAHPEELKKCVKLENGKDKTKNITLNQLSSADITRQTKPPPLSSEDEVVVKVENNNDVTTDEENHALVIDESKAQSPSKEMSNSRKLLSNLKLLLKETQAQMDQFSNDESPTLASEEDVVDEGNHYDETSDEENHSLVIFESIAQSPCYTTDEESHALVIDESKTLSPSKQAETDITCSSQQVAENPNPSNSRGSQVKKPRARKRPHSKKPCHVLAVSTNASLQVNQHSTSKTSPVFPVSISTSKEANDIAKVVNSSLQGIVNQHRTSKTSPECPVSIGASQVLAELAKSLQGNQHSTSTTTPVFPVFISASKEASQPEHDIARVVNSSLQGIVNQHRTSKTSPECPVSIGASQVLAELAKSLQDYQPGNSTTSPLFPVSISTSKAVNKQANSSLQTDEHNTNKTNPVFPVSISASHEANKPIVSNRPLLQINEYDYSKHSQTIALANKPILQVSQHAASKPSQGIDVSNKPILQVNQHAAGKPSQGIVVSNKPILQVNQHAAGKLSQGIVVSKKPILQLNQHAASKPSQGIVVSNKPILQLNQHAAGKPSQGIVVSNKPILQVNQHAASKPSQGINVSNKPILQVSQHAATKPSQGPAVPNNMPLILHINKDNSSQGLVVSKKPILRGSQHNASKPSQSLAVPNRPILQVNQPNANSISHGIIVSNRPYLHLNQHGANKASQSIVITNTPVLQVNQPGTSKRGKITGVSNKIVLEVKKHSASIPSQVIAVSNKPILRVNKHAANEASPGIPVSLRPIHPVNKHAASKDSQGRAVANRPILPANKHAVSKASQGIAVANRPIHPFNKHAARKPSQVIAPSNKPILQVSQHASSKPSQGIAVSNKPILQVNQHATSNLIQGIAVANKPILQANQHADSKLIQGIAVANKPILQVNQHSTSKPSHGMDEAYRAMQLVTPQTSTKSNQDTFLLNKAILSGMNQHISQKKQGIHNAVSNSSGHKTKKRIVRNSKLGLGISKRNKTVKEMLVHRSLTNLIKLRVNAQLNTSHQPDSTTTIKPGRRLVPQIKPDKRTIYHRASLSLVELSKMASFNSSTNAANEQHDYCRSSYETSSWRTKNLLWMFFERNYQFTGATVCNVCGASSFGGGLDQLVSHLEKKHPEHNRFYTAGLYCKYNWFVTVKNEEADKCFFFAGVKTDSFVCLLCREMCDNSERYVVKEILGNDPIHLLNHLIRYHPTDYFKIKEETKETCNSSSSNKEPTNAVTDQCDTVKLTSQTDAPSPAPVDAVVNAENHNDVTSDEESHSLLIDESKALSPSEQKMEDKPANDDQKATGITTPTCYVSDKRVTLKSVRQECKKPRSKFQTFGEALTSFDRMGHFGDKKVKNSKRKALHCNTRNTKRSVDKKQKAFHSSVGTIGKARVIVGDFVDMHDASSSATEGTDKLRTRKLIISYNKNSGRNQSTNVLRKASKSTARKGHKSNTLLTNNKRKALHSYIRANNANVGHLDDKQKASSSTNRKAICGDKRSVDSKKKSQSSYVRMVGKTKVGDFVDRHGASSSTEPEVVDRKANTTNDTSTPNEDRCKQYGRVKTFHLTDVYCEKCDKIFSTPRVLKQHNRIHTGNMLVCPVCSKEFVYNSAFGIHKKRHEGKLLFVCHTCDKRFVIKARLRRHLRIHTGEKPYLCSVCGKGFNQAGSLTIHIRRHTGEKPYPCRFCDKRFIQGATRNLHEKWHEINMC